MSTETVSGFLAALSSLITIVMLKLLVPSGIFRHRRLLSGDNRVPDIWPAKLEPVTSVALTLRGDSHEALTSALAGLPATVERIAIVDWDSHDLTRRPTVTRTYLSQPTSQVFGVNSVMMPPDRPWGQRTDYYPLDPDLPYVYLRPMQPTRYRRWVEPVRVRDRRILREATAEVEALLA